MKKKIFYISFLFLSFSLSAQVGINTDSPQGILDIVSDDSGVLLPRLSNVQIKNMDNAVEGMVVYNTSLGCLMINLRPYNSSEGTDWRCLLVENGSPISEENGDRFQENTDDLIQVESSKLLDR